MDICSEFDPLPPPALLPLRKRLLLILSYISVDSDLDCFLLTGQSSGVSGTPVT